MLCELKNISKNFARVKAVKNVNLLIEEGDSLGLVGESGSGKTTLARILLGLIRPDSGQIIFREDMPRFRIAQIVFQDPQTSLNPRIKIGEAISEPIKIHKILPKDKIDGKVKELLNLVGLPPDYAARVPHALSGGERQRVGIARALAMEPKFLILDEPVSALDVNIQLKLLKLLKELKTKLKLTYLFIAHDLSVVGFMCSKVAVMYQGEIVESGETEKIFSKPREGYTKKLLASVL